jgi:hypothetical protein
MFQVSKEEKEQLVETYGHLETLKFSPVLPNVFTEHGAVMLASVLNSARAIEVNIRIIRVFNYMRQALLNYKEVLLKIEQLEKQTLQNTGDVRILFEYIRQLIVPPEQAERQRIGFRRQDEQE